ncbi:Holliday junction branch migration protein RuvA [Bifidobacterium angulatum]|uniref:Holliday junction branch migration protein RuvA n=1 Tax=Bifidobacterium angulatum TaxID=1683 RepID=UPI00265812EC|nr:Holliday junction branch migration protein RuvA [Bifidobacterium angulatum]
MIGSLRGAVEMVDTTQAVIEVGSVGYEVRMPSADLSRLHTGQETRVWTYLNVSQDAITLYGFLDSSSKKMFLQLIKVNGVGPKVALSLLSTLTANDLAKAVADNDATALAKAPGIGKKGAQKIILELKGSINLEDLGEKAPQSGASTDPGAKQVVEGLMSLGWHQQDAQYAVQEACESNGIAMPLSQEDVPQVLRLALTSLDRGR